MVEIHPMNEHVARVPDVEDGGARVGDCQAHAGVPRNEDGAGEGAVKDESGGEGDGVEQADGHGAPRGVVLAGHEVLEACGSDGNIRGGAGATACSL